MASKRKAQSHTHEKKNSAGEPYRKRPRKTYLVISSSEAESGSDESDLDDNEYFVKCILDEDDSSYLIDWEGQWTPSWVPKEYANDLAVKAWEEKKRRAASAQKTWQSVDGSALPSIVQTVEPEHSSIQVVPSSISNDSSSRSASRNPETTEASAEHPPLGPDSQVERRTTFERNVSPLFVTPEPVFEFPPSGNREAPIEIPETQLAGYRPFELISNARRGDSHPNRAAPNSEIPYCNAPFEYIGRSSIPPEYKLPDEAETFAKSRDSVSLLSADPDVEESSGSLRPDQTEELVYIDLTRGPESKPERDRPDEIAETPSAAWVVTESQPNPESERGTVTFVSSSHSIISGQRRWDSTNPSGFEEKFSSLSTTALTIYHSNSASQSTERPSQARNSELPSTNPSQEGLKESKSTMDRENSRGATPRSDFMEKYSSFPGSTQAEKMENARAQMRETIEQSRKMLRASAGPSGSPVRAPSAEMARPLGSVLDKEHVPPTQTNPVTETLSHQPEVPSPKYEEEPMQTIQPSALTARHTEPTPGSVQLGVSEFAIPLPMDSRVKSDYEEVLRHESRSIMEFMSAFGSSSKLSEPEHVSLGLKMQEVLEQLGNVTTHPDLNRMEHISHSQSDLEQEASWGEYSSAKFLLLRYLVQMASGRDLHFVLMTQTPKLLEVVERFLLGKGFAHTRPRDEMGPGTNSELSMAKDSLSFGIQITHGDGIVQTYRPPSVIIALDRSFNTQNPSVEHMRTTYARNGHLLPAIRLLISNTSEHIERCLPDVPPLQRLRLLIHHTTCLLDVVGDLQDDALGVEEDAEEILTCLSSDNFNAHWSLPLVEPLQIASLDELDSILQMNQSGQTPEDSLNAEPATQKRAVQAEETAEQVPKRQRMEPQVALQSIESSIMPSQTDTESMRNSQAAEFERLKEALSNTESRLQESGRILEQLQHRYESRTKEMHKIRQERDGLNATKITLEQRVEKQREDITKLKDERTELKHELSQARETIKNGGGSAAELEQANEEIRRLTKENAGLERKAEYEKNQGEYTREQYQNASTAAAQSGNEIRQLRTDNETLNRKLAGEASRLRELNIQNDQERHLVRVKELESTLASRDDLLKRKEDELREIRKNRPSTRSTSTQPRSPKFSAANSRPSSPGLNNNYNGSNLLGRGSALRFSSEMH